MQNNGAVSNLLMAGCPLRKVNLALFAQQMVYIGQSAGFAADLLYYKSYAGGNDSCGGRFPLVCRVEMPVVQDPFARCCVEFPVPAALGNINLRGFAVCVDCYAHPHRALGAFCPQDRGVGRFGCFAV